MKNSKVQGFRLLSCQLTILAYADDLVLVCSDKPSIQEAMKCVSDFCATSGAAVNREKRSGSWCGMWGTTPLFRYVDITWSTQKLELLGVPLCAMEQPEVDVGQCRNELNRLLACWNMRYLSIFGRIVVCNIFFPPKLMYLLHIIHCSRVMVLLRSIEDGGLESGHYFGKAGNCQVEVLSGTTTSDPRNL
uniref:Putative tick transposon n=1 Tax=Ixodes ricinus TaxID=34613 RepID=A0A6B0V1B7_IXORI